jgi:hypothetical protein
VPLPDDVAVNVAVVVELGVILPIPPVTDQDGVTSTMLLLESLATDVNTWVLPDITVAEPGVTAMLSTTPAVPVALKVTGEPERPVEVAATVFAPAVVPRVRVEEALPSEPVVVLVTERDPPPEVTAKVTLTPLTALLLASFTITTNGLDSTVPTVPL